jgi:hypothetical protein
MRSPVSRCRSIFRAYTSSASAELVCPIADTFGFELERDPPFVETPDDVD